MYSYFFLSQYFIETSTKWAQLSKHIIATFMLSQKCSSINIVQALCYHKRTSQKNASLQSCSSKNTAAQMFFKLIFFINPSQINTCSTHPFSSNHHRIDRHPLVSFIRRIESETTVNFRHFLHQSYSNRYVQCQCVVVLICSCFAMAMLMSVIPTSWLDSAL